MIVHLFRRSHLLDFALVHDHNIVGQAEGFALIVRDVERGNPQTLLHPADFHARLHAEFGVKIGERLVE